MISLFSLEELEDGLSFYFLPKSSSSLEYLLMSVVLPELSRPTINNYLKSVAREAIIWNLN